MGYISTFLTDFQIYWHEMNLNIIFWDNSSDPSSILVYSQSTINWNLLNHWFSSLFLTLHRSDSTSLKSHQQKVLLYLNQNWHIDTFWGDSAFFFYSLSLKALHIFHEKKRKSPDLILFSMDWYYSSNLMSLHSHFPCYPFPGTHLSLSRQDTVNLLHVPSTCSLWATDSLKY